ncbi:MAG: UDP-N-acetylmuramoyl-tripeptide--D-alanyl-D-alanine ligase [Nocardioidaceae bacterium]
MISLSLAEIAEIVGGRVSEATAEHVVSAEPFHDSRAVVPGGLFVAVQGVHVDGHDYARAAVEAGAAAALTERAVGVPAVVVDSPVDALGLLTTAVLERLPHLRVIGITGSQGKTSAKDMLAQILESVGETVATAGNLNTEIGVPMTALRATPQTRFLVVEMGARGRGHIGYLASMVSPSVGVVLNVGVAHLSEFGSKDRIAEAKGELIDALPADGMAVLNADDGLVAAMRRRTAARVATFGESGHADVQISDLHADEQGRARFRLSADGSRTDVALQLIGEHQAVNAAAAATVALELDVGLTLGDVSSLLARAVARSHWRMEPSTTPAGVVVLNDAYNANPDSVRAALKTLVGISQLRAGARSFAVLGEMLELGETSVAEHDAVGRLVAELGVSQLVVVGEGARGIERSAAAEGGSGSQPVYVPDADAAIGYLHAAVRRDDVVLVKASRATGLESVATALADATGPGVGGDDR